MEEEAARIDEQQQAQAQTQRVRADFDSRSLLDRKAALNLVQFAQLNDDIDLGADALENLLDTLIVRTKIPDLSPKIYTNTEVILGRSTCRGHLRLGNYHYCREEAHRPTAFLYHRDPLASHIRQPSRSS